MSEFVFDLIADNTNEFTSSAIELLAYNRENNELYIEFTSGGEYIYDGVFESTYNLFIQADSLGKFYRNNIQGVFTSRDATGAWLILRETDEEPVDLKPEVRYLTADSNVLFAGGPVAPEPSQFGVKYTVEHANFPHPYGPFEPTFTALSEADTLLQFENSIKQMENLTGWILKTKILAVTHYFD